MEDRLIREAESKERREHNAKVVRGLQDEIKGIMEVHTATTRDYLNLRQEAQRKEKVCAVTTAALVFFYLSF